MEYDFKMLSIHTEGYDLISTFSMVKLAGHDQANFATNTVAQLF